MRSSTLGGPRRLRAAADRAAVGLLLLAAWQLASLAAGDYWFSSPLTTWRTVMAGLQSGELVRHSAYTLGAAALGFAIGGVPGVWLPMLLRRSPRLRRILDPFMVAGYGLPKLALAPLFVLWFGIGAEAKVVLVASVVFFLLFFSTTAGVQAIEPRMIQMARVAGATNAQILRKIVWPSVLPHVFNGIRIATPYAIGGVVISELISSNRGLGYLVQLGATNFSAPDIFAAVATITVVTGAASWVVGLAEHRASRWRGRIANDPTA
ncbi:ABC transporter permease [Variovorax sp. M-6]|uniref:ABC transporter permease n=1 Tax=Variovorax sp. M-6 TaxID=3233041 RepID=UPI003F95D21F